jgi:hypothetical protein
MIRRKVLMGKEVSIHMDWLDLKDDDLVIKRPSRKEWPEHVYEQWAKDVPWGRAMRESQ